MKNESKNEHEKESLSGLTRATQNALTGAGIGSRSTLSVLTSSRIGVIHLLRLDRIGNKRIREIKVWLGDAIEYHHGFDEAVRFIVNSEKDILRRSWKYQTKTELDVAVSSSHDFLHRALTAEKKFADAQKEKNRRLENVEDDRLVALRRAERSDKILIGLVRSILSGDDTERDKQVKEAQNLLPALWGDFAQFGQAMDAATRAQGEPQ